MRRSPARTVRPGMSSSEAATPDTTWAPAARVHASWSCPSARRAIVWITVASASSATGAPSSERDMAHVG